MRGQIGRGKKGANKENDMLENKRFELLSGSRSSPFLTSQVVIARRPRSISTSNWAAGSKCEHIQWIDAVNPFVVSRIIYSAYNFENAG